MNNRNKRLAVGYSCSWKEDPTIATGELTVCTCVNIVKEWKKGEEDQVFQHLIYFQFITWDKCFCQVPGNDQTIQYQMELLASLPVYCKMTSII